MGLLGNTIQVRAHQVQEGDYIPGLDNAYVISTDEGDHFIYPSSAGYPTRVGEDFVLITYNDRDGGENYLLLLADTLLTINRPDEDGTS